MVKEEEFYNQRFKALVNEAYCLGLNSNEGERENNSPFFIPEEFSNEAIINPGGGITLKQIIARVSNTLEGVKEAVGKVAAWVGEGVRKGAVFSLAYI